MARARCDLDRILRYSVRTYGHDAADRYELLAVTAMGEVGVDPLIMGSREVPQRSGLRTYSISHSRLRVPRQMRVASPTHQLVYRTAPDGVVEILAVVGDNYPATGVTAPGH